MKFRSFFWGPSSYFCPLLFWDVSYPCSICGRSSVSFLKFITLAPAERSMIVRSIGGDYAILKAQWIGFRRKEFDLKSNRLAVYLIENFPKFFFQQIVEKKFRIYFWNLNLFYGQKTDFWNFKTGKPIFDHAWRSFSYISLNFLSKIFLIFISFLNFLASPLTSSYTVGSIAWVISLLNVFIYIMYINICILFRARNNWRISGGILFANVFSEFEADDNNWAEKRFITSWRYTFQDATNVSTTFIRYFLRPIQISVACNIVCSPTNFYKSCCKVLH